MKRDSHGIVIQTSEQDPSYGDGGDSAFSTGLLAFAGSLEDKRLMIRFIKYGKLVRHPFQSATTGTASHDDPRATSRDQVIAFFAGLSQIQAGEVPDEDLSILRAACLKYAESWWVNSDILMPAHKYYLYRCAKMQVPPGLVPLACANQALSLIWDTLIRPNHEMNQAVCINAVYGRTWLRLLRRLHPGLSANLRDYFSGWRSRSAIGEALIKKIS